MKSVIKDIELTDGSIIYIQISKSVPSGGSRTCLSFDGPNIQVSQWMNIEVLRELANKINEAIKEFEHGTENSNRPK